MSLEISDAFTVEDIHRVREINYERQKNMTDKEAIEDNKKRLHLIKEQLKNNGLLKSG
jgi:hypothetical protein